MKRVIVTPPVLPPAALGELKQWLGISTAHDDGPLAAQLRAAVDMCEAFIGQVSLACTCEEALSPAADWQVLSARPVQSISSVSALSAHGARTALPASAYAMELDPDGTGRLLVIAPGNAAGFVAQFTAGLAADWDALPEALRQGVIRLAAHQHRERENNGAAPLPPASVAALWRPWRRLRLT